MEEELGQAATLLSAAFPRYRFTLCVRGQLLLLLLQLLLVSAQPPHCIDSLHVTQYCGALSGVCS